MTRGPADGATPEELRAYEAAELAAARAGFARINPDDWSLPHEILWDEAPMYCTDCGRLLVLATCKSGRFDVRTGQRVADTELRCPRFATSAFMALFVDGHDCYAMLPSEQQPGKFLAPWGTKRWR